MISIVEIETDPTQINQVDPFRLSREDVVSLENKNLINPCMAVINHYGHWIQYYILERSYNDIPKFLDDALEGNHLDLLQYGIRSIPIPSERLKQASRLLPLAISQGKQDIVDYLSDSSRIILDQSIY